MSVRHIRPQVYILLKIALREDLTLANHASGARCLKRKLQLRGYHARLQPTRRVSWASTNRNRPSARRSPGLLGSVFLPAPDRTDRLSSSQHILELARDALHRNTHHPKPSTLHPDFWSRSLSYGEVAQGRARGHFTIDLSSPRRG